MENKTLKDLKVGDEVWSIQTGIDFVKAINELIYLEGGESYYPNGNYRNKDFIPSLYFTNPFEEKLEGKYMMVSDDNEYWHKRFVIISSCDEIFVKYEWEFYKEIEKKETLPLAVAEISLEQIAEKFGLDVEQIRIKP